MSSRQQEQQDPGLEQVYLIWYSPLIPFLWNHTIILWPGQNINCLSSAFTIERTDAFIVQPKSARYTNYGSRQYQLVKAISTVLMKTLQEDGILADSVTLVCHLTFCRLVDFDKWIWTWWWDEQACLIASRDFHRHRDSPSVASWDWLLWKISRGDPNSQLASN